ncbi:helicase-related protein [Candidatus Solirubrobacter pratensis]|uniref:helicase-related protein n=1 Tax=Candidatus Solirubrobacter pratensis TaxID=1298857 RepID=UPI000487C329|nr:helicase-related protein [Candidatus Solirubrobacter pratensis]
MSYAAGTLVRARGREWVVLPESDEDLLVLRPLGGTDAEVAGILRALEAVEPASFSPPDAAAAGDATRARLLRDALRLGFRSSAGPFRSFGRIGVEPRPYQLVPLLMALKLDPVRLLIADDVGIGKTIEASLIARELMAQGTIERFAVLCPPHLAEQWRDELRAKFGLEATLVLASTARRLERALPAHESLFEHHDHVVVSTDFIKSPARREEFVRTCPELVIVDEAHTFASAGDRARQLRHELLLRLGSDSGRHLILVTATPHSGKENAFSSLLGTLSPELGALPADLSGGAGEAGRRLLARHLVQRRRGDITAYADTETPFPRREQPERDPTYRLSPEHRELFQRAIAYARDAAGADGDERRVRVRWWSALALLRAIGSSPAAAAATLRSRAASADAATPEEAEELGRRTVLDLSDEDEESPDVAPGAQEEGADAALRSSSWFNQMARDAEALAGAGDPKLQGAVKLIKDLLRDGFNPIVFCRFIPTAEYLAEHLHTAVGRRASVACVTGRLAPAEREQRIDELSGAARRVLVCTDCLSEGINLQDAFDAVVHYDLSWNPTRHEQREGRVDRYGQPSPAVRVLPYYGEDSPIDGLVLDVLLRKHRAIRDRLGVSIPVPVDSGAVMSAVLEGVLRRRSPDTRADQLMLEGFESPARDALHADWETAATQEERSRTGYAQRTIQVEDVVREVRAMEAAVGAGTDVLRFAEQSLAAHGAVVRRDEDGAIEALVDEVPRALREALGDAVHADRFDIARRGGALALTRTHPAVEALAQHVLDAALDGDPAAVATRCGVLRTGAVDTLTTILLVRLRFTLTLGRGERARDSVAEDALTLAFTGDLAAPSWRSQEEVERLLDASPAGSIPPDLRARVLTRALAGLDAMAGALADRAAQQAQEIEDAHQRVRAGARASGALRVTPQGTPDVLGLYVYLPAGTL